MKKIRLFKAAWCPHCRNAQKWLNEILEKNKKYKDIHVTTIDIDHQKELLTGVNFYYVPTFYVEDKKVFEGVPSKEIITKVLEEAFL